jgi:hypothetical protein
MLYLNGIQDKPTAKLNPQSNAVFERFESSFTSNLLEMPLQQHTLSTRPSQLQCMHFEIRSTALLGLLPV